MFLLIFQDNLAIDYLSVTVYDPASFSITGLVFSNSFVRFGGKQLTPTINLTRAYRMVEVSVSPLLWLSRVEKQATSYKY